MSDADDAILVARIGKPHGLRGEVTVQLHTDAPQDRLAIGSDLQTDPAARGRLTVRSVRVHQGRYLLGFDGVEDREGAESLRDTKLFVLATSASGDLNAVDPDSSSGDSEEYYEAELVGMSALSTSGEIVGAVTALHTRAAQDLLEITRTHGGVVLVPFVTQLVPVVDRGRREVVIDPPAGLIEIGS